MAQQYEQMAQTIQNFYTKLRGDNKEAFEKLYTSGGSSAELPEFPSHLESYAEDQIGSWVFNDPSKFQFQSWLVAKWKGMQGDFDKQLQGIKVVEKLIPVCTVLVIAMMAKFYMSDLEQFAQFLNFCKWVTELGILVAIVKLLKVCKILEFTSWKLFGTLTKLEFAMVPAG